MYVLPALSTVNLSLSLTAAQISFQIRKLILHFKTILCPFFGL